MDKIISACSCCSRFNCNSSVLFLFKALLMSVFKMSNISLLLQRFLTIFMVLMHYTVVEKIDYFEHGLRQNESSFIQLVVVWHLVFMNLKIGEEGRRFKYAIHQTIIIGICGFFGISTVLTVLFTPILSWFSFSCTHLETTYWSLRYLMVFFYIAFNVLISLFPHVHNFLFLVSDGLVLSQLASLYLFNEFSMSALLTCLPVLFVLHNHLLVKGIRNFVRDEQAGKMSFVRLIGRHDAVFLFVIYSLFTALFILVDTFSADYRLACNMWYFVYALYAFGKLMGGDNKNIQSKWLYRLSLLSVLVFTAVYVFTLKGQKNPFPNREFPLFKLPEALNATVSMNQTIGNETVSANETIGIVNATEEVIVAAASVAESAAGDI